MLQLTADGSIAKKKKKVPRLGAITAHYYSMRIRTETLVSIRHLKAGFRLPEQTVNGELGPSMRRQKLHRCRRVNLPI